LKESIRASYIALLQETYPFYVEGSRPLALAHVAADAALAGKVKLKGDCWEMALIANGLSPRITLKALAALP